MSSYICQDILPEDSLSLQLYTPELLEQSKTAAAANVSYLDSLQFDQLSQDDFEKLRDYYLACRDRANYNYYTYLARYGIKGSTKPLRNEGDDLTHRLAIAMGIRFLLPIDDHQTDKEYNQAWLDAVNSGTENGDLEIYADLTKRVDRSRIFPALTGRLGRFTNRKDILECYYKINSLRYAQHPNEKTELAKSLWDGRNERMAMHIKVHHPDIRQQDLGLTKREMEIIRLISMGKNASDIAEELYISLRTVNNHKYHIYSKMNVRRSSELIAKARKAKII